MAVEQLVTGTVTGKKCYSNRHSAQQLICQCQEAEEECTCHKAGQQAWEEGSTVHEVWLFRCPHSCWLQLSIAAASAFITAASRSLAADASGDDPTVEPFGKDDPIDAFWKVLQYVGDCQMDMVTTLITRLTWV